MFRALGIALAVASASVLAWKGLGLALGPSLSSVLSQWDVQIDVVAAPLDGVASWARKVAPASNGAEVPVAPLWTHMFILLWIFFGSFAQSFSGSPRWPTTIFGAVWSGVVALGSGIAIGLAGLSGTTVALIALGAFGLFNFGLGLAAAAFAPEARRSIGENIAAELSVLALWCGSLVFIGDRLSKIASALPIASPGLLVLAAVVVAFALVATIGSAISLVGRETSSRGDLPRRIARFADGVFWVAGGSGAVLLAGLVTRV